jgi:Protein of unknown function (DUF3352)
MRKLLLLIAAVCISALVASACGNQQEAASGASELVPSGAVVYGEADLHPGGDQKQAIDSILSKFPGGGQAGDRLKDLIENGLRRSDAPVSFKKDIEPWLGDEAAFFVSGAGQNGQEPASAGLIAADDEDKARAALEKSAEGKTQEHTYKDVDYLTDESGEAGAVFDGFLVLGTEPGVKAAIETSKGGEKLSDDDDFTNATDDVSSDRLGLLYVNSPEFANLARERGTALPDSFRKFFKEPVVATAKAEDDGVVFESTVPPELARSFAFFGEASDVLADLPAESWLAVGQKDLGKLLDHYVDAFAGIAGGRDAIEGQFEVATGLDLQQDVLSWMGDFGVFVRGSSLSSLDGALVVQTSDEEASRRFLSALERLARTQAGNGARIESLANGFAVQIGDLPKPIVALVKSGKVVFAYGNAAASEALDPADALGESAAFKSVRDSLGDYDVSFFLLVKPILDLVDSTPSANDAHWQQTKPYLEPLDALVGGTSGSGDDVKSAFKLIVK